MLYINVNYLRDFFRPHRNMLLENMALRQQILVLERQVKGPRFKDHERVFLVLLSRYWPGWRKPLLCLPKTQSLKKSHVVEIGVNARFLFSLMQMDRAMEFWGGTTVLFNNH